MRLLSVGVQTIICCIISLANKVTLLQDEVIDNDNYLYEMEPLSELGRYLNQSESDFITKMQPSCNCGNLPGSNFSNQFCYCTMRCPIPEHPFTRELLFPDDITCLSNVTTPLEMQGRLRSKPLFPWFCDRTDDLHDHKARWFTFLCIQGFSLNHVKHFFDINPAWTPMISKDWHLLSKYNWRSSSSRESTVVPPESEQGIIANNENLIEPTDLLTTNWMQPISKTNSSDMIRKIIGNINFTTQDNGSFRSFHVLKPMDFTISAPTQCSQLSGGRSFEECTYLIKLAGGNCTQLREAVLIAVRIIAFTLTNVTTLDDGMMSGDGQLHRRQSGNNVSNSEEEWMKDTTTTTATACESIPDHGMITEVRYHTSVVGVYASYDRYLSNGNNTTEFPMRLSYNRVYISAQHFANLPRFWNEIVYGKCPERYCWRDLGEIGPSRDAWRLSSLDEILFRNVVYCLVPLFPILAYFLLDSVLF